MKCTKCGCTESKVIDSRPSEDSVTIRRRRECTKCKNRFTTYERVELTPLLIAKKDGTREEFDRGKILSGIMKACEKRPVTLETMEKIVSDIESEVTETQHREIDSVAIGEAVMAHLKKVDEVAYVRFASVYRSFKDIDTFMEEIMQLKNELAKPRK